jgi:maleylpyruvate isomerase
MNKLVFHGYWRSSASYRVRIALNLKGLVYRTVAHDLRSGEQRDPGYLALNPLGLVPALETPDGVLTQSGAIIEWLEETCPAPSLLPGDAAGRAAARAMASLIACDIQPLANLRVLKALRSDLGADQAAVDDWARGWIAKGFDALEVLLGRQAGDYAMGAAPGIVDCHAVPQAYNAERLGMDLGAWPRLAAVVAAGRAHPAIAAAAPELQPGAG